MQQRNAIVVVVDSLQAGQLGAYGNTWIDTPHLDELAAESFVFDSAVIDSPDAEVLLRSYWRELLQSLARHGAATTLLTDDASVAEHPLAAEFSQRTCIPASDTAESADEPHQTQMARLFTAAGEAIGEQQQPSLLWLHSRGMSGPWDAPLEFRNEYADEDEVTPLESTEVPCRTLPDDFDPDELLRIVYAYAGQVSLLDLCVGSLMQSLAESRQAADTLLVVLGMRGFPLGEHGRLGRCDDALYGELLHVPWMMRFPDGRGAAARSAALVQPADLSATLLDWWELDAAPARPAGHNLLPLIDGDVQCVRDRVCAFAGEHEKSIRTPAWHIRLAQTDEGEITHLYAKPDDRWEVNEVANRCPGVVEELRKALDDFQRAGDESSGSQLPPLSEVLLRGLG